MTHAFLTPRRVTASAAAPAALLLIAASALPMHAEASCPQQHSVNSVVGTGARLNKRNVIPNGWVAAYRQLTRSNGSFGQAYAFSAPVCTGSTLRWSHCADGWTSGKRAPVALAYTRLCSQTCYNPSSATDAQRSCPCPCFFTPGDDHQSITGFSGEFLATSGSTTVTVSPESGLRIVARQPLADEERPSTSFTINITDASGAVVAAGSVELAVRGGSEGNTPELVKTGFLSDLPFVVEGGNDEFFVSLAPLAQRAIIDISTLDLEIQLRSAGPDPVNTCAADCNADGVVDLFDYLDFVNAFSSQGPGSDFNSDQVVDFFDYLDFVQSFSDGC